jgi:hypothetical protein
MNRLTSVVGALVVTGTLVAHGEAGLTGTWEGDTDGGASLVLVLRVKETALTGTLTRNGQSAPISEGKVSKNTFTFKATLNERAEGFSGELAGEQIRIWLERQGPAKAIVLKRSKSR